MRELQTERPKSRGTRLSGEKRTPYWPVATLGCSAWARHWVPVPYGFVVEFVFW